MHFEPSREAAVSKLNYFINNGLNNYSKLRNFDFGSEDRDFCAASVLMPLCNKSAGINETTILIRSLMIIYQFLSYKF